MPLGTGAQSVAIENGMAREQRADTHRCGIRFDAFASQLVAERQWHPSQKINRLPGGESELSMTLGSLEEVERWVLSWGGHARVLEPVELKRMIRRAAQAMLAEE